MSYTLEDIVNALHRRQLQQQQQQQQAAQQQPQRLYRSSPQYRVIPSYAFSPYQSIYAGGFDDDDSDEEDYQPRYPAYYGTPYYSRPVRQQAATRPQESQQQQRSNQSQPQSQEAAGTSGIDTLFDFLTRLAGPPMGADGMDVDDEEKEQNVKKNDDETKSDDKKDVESGKSEESSKEKESSNEPQAPSSTAGSTSTSVPKLKKTHSTAQFQEPRPKIELSQRNVRDPSIPYSPQTNIYESHESYDLVLAIPGASIKNLDIDFHPSTNELVIKGNVPAVSEVFGPKPTSEFVSKVDEIRTGSIERRIKFPNLPKIIDDQIKAKYVNGLLTIKIPKNLESEKQKVKRKVIVEDVPDEELF